MSKLRVGIVGFGRIGAEHAGWIDASAMARATVVMDATPARQDLARERGLRVVPNFSALLEDPEVDAVLIASPTAMHFEHAMAALSASKPVMIEKPMALDLAQATKLRDAARSRNLPITVFHNRRWDPDYLALRAAIEAGVFGKLINVESRIGQFASCVGPAAREYRPNWRNEAAFGGGGLYDWGSHLVDQMWQLLLPATPQRIFAQLRGNLWSRDCDDFARILIDFDNGVASMVEINTTTNAPLPRWQVDGSLGSASSPSSAKFDVNVWADLSFIPAEGQVRKLPRATGGLNETQIWDQFARCVIEGQPPPVHVQNVLKTMALLDAARISSREGRAVDVRLPE